MHVCVCVRAGEKKRERKRERKSACVCVYLQTDRSHLKPVSHNPLYPPLIPGHIKTMIRHHMYECRSVCVQRLFWLSLFILLSYLPI